MRAEGRTYAEIKTATGASKSTISFHCSKLDSNTEIIQQNILKRYPVSEVVLREFTDEVSEILHNLVAEGVNRIELSDALSITTDELDKYVSHHGLVKNRVFEEGYRNIKRRRRRLKMLAVMRLGGKCESCGYKKNIKALDFHHKDNTTKEFSISKVANRAWKNVKNEVDKCSLLCANCHREIHDD